MARKQRVKGTIPTAENAIGRFDVDDLDEDGEVINDENEIDETVDISKGIVVFFQEPVFTLRSGSEVLKSGGKKSRIFSPETNGKDYKKVAEEFIATMKLQDGEKRPKYLSHKEID